MVNRHVIGAHYGLRDWLMQRVTAVIMVAYTVALVLLLLSIPSDFDGWKALFSETWVRIFTQVTLLALFLHVWVGIRDVWMDYVKPVGLRLALQVVTIVWLVGCIGWGIQVLWRL